MDPAEFQRTKYQWLAWTEGDTSTTLYAKDSDREKDVYLKINNHQPEKLKRVLRKRTTRFNHYLKTGRIADPKLYKDPRDMYHETMHTVNVLMDPLKQIPDYRPEKKYRRKSIQWYNSSQAGWREKRCKQWSFDNVRPQSEWDNEARKSQDSSIRAECIRKRNRNSIYKVE